MAAYTLLNRSQDEWTKTISDAFKVLPSIYPKYPCPAPGSLEFAKLIDHTLLKTDATAPQIDTLCEEAQKFQFKTVCVRLDFVARAITKLQGSGVDVACVVDFHEGTGPTAAKVRYELNHLLYGKSDPSREALAAVSAGAKELDIVIHHPLLHSDGSDFATAYASIYSSLLSVRNACPAPQTTLKVILETSQLTTEEIVAGSVLSIAAGADFIKTSTGFLGRGASIEDVQVMRAVAENPEILDLRVAESRSRPVKVKASGGIRSAADVVKMVEAGAERIGASAGVAIMSETGGLSSKQENADGY